MKAKKKKSENKHLVIEVLTTKWGKWWRVKEQTHREAAFGFRARGSSYSYGGFTLISCCFPDTKDIGYGAYVRGSQGDTDMEMCPVPSEKWLAKLRAAVRSYNDYFSSPPRKGEPESSIETVE